MSPQPLLTHTVAACCYIISSGKFLLLKRSQPPFIWAPPGGRLYLNEAPEAGVIREIKEETNLNVRIIDIVDVWFGHLHGHPLLSIDYLGVPTDDAQLRLSVEHSAALWLSLAELRRSTPVCLDAPAGFQLADFEKASKRFHSR